MPDPKNPKETKENKELEKVENAKSDHNLFILGVVAIGIAVVTTSVSLLVYHNSGDIYLDRSRPGFLPDEEEVQTRPVSSYSFSTTGQLTEDELGEYIEHFEEAIDTIDNLENPFSDTPLSDSSLGIPAAPPAENPET